MSPNTAALLYLVSGVLFILALRGLSSPATSRQGNLFGMAGMAIAIVVTLASHPPASLFSWILVIVGLGIEQLEHRGRPGWDHVDRHVDITLGVRFAPRD